MHLGFTYKCLTNPYVKKSEDTFVACRKVARRDLRLYWKGRPSTHSGFMNKCLTNPYVKKSEETFFCVQESCKARAALAPGGDHLRHALRAARRAGVVALLVDALAGDVDVLECLYAGACPQLPI